MTAGSSLTSPSPPRTPAAAYDVLLARVLPQGSAVSAIDRMVMGNSIRSVQPA